MTISALIVPQAQGVKKLAVRQRERIEKMPAL